MALNKSNTPIMNKEIMQPIAMQQKTNFGFLKHLMRVPYSKGDKTIPLFRLAGNAVPTLDESKENSIVVDSAKLDNRLFSEYYAWSKAYEMSTDIDIRKIGDDLIKHKINAGVGKQLLFSGSNNSSTAEEKAVKLPLFVHAHNDIATSKVGEPLKFTDLLNAYSWVENPKFVLISQEAQLSILDNNGNEKLSFDNVPEDAQATFLGLPVYYVQQIGTSDINIAFTVAAEDSYVLMENEFEVREIETLNGYQRTITKNVGGARGNHQTGKWSLAFAK